MTDRPILFTAEMVRAILDGRKTQTRRLNGLEDVNGYPGRLSGKSGDLALGYLGLLASDYWLKPSMKKVFRKTPGVFHKFIGENEREINPIPVRCPYGQPGDRLWVRETWGVYDRIVCCPDDLPNFQDKDGVYHPVVHFAGKEDYAWGMYGPPRKRSGRFMPRTAARILLEIVNIRVERVQEISELDAMAEGVCVATVNVAQPGFKIGDPLERHVDVFRCLWDSINLKRGYGWDVNPWVWVIEFRRVDHNI